MVESVCRFVRLRLDFCFALTFARISNSRKRKLSVANCVAQQKLMIFGAMVVGEKGSMVAAVDYLDRWNRVMVELIHLLFSFLLAIETVELKKCFGSV